MPGPPLAVVNACTRNGRGGSPTAVVIDDAALLQPRGEQISFGAYDPAAPPIGLGEKVVARMLSAVRAALPAEEGF